jgi:OmcA/MtrC family decaheme c-type cytochrome
MRITRLLLVAGLAAALSACTGSAGTDGTSCSVTNNADGTATITCTDGTSVTVANGHDGSDGASCTVEDNGDGTSTISCDDGTSVTVTNGQNGGSCTVVSNPDGSSTIKCDDGSTVTVSNGSDGQNGSNFRVTDLHGTDYLSSLDAAAGKYMVVATITGATADAAGKVTVDFSVATDKGDPVANIPSINADVDKLVVTNVASGANLTNWVPYIYASETVSGNSYPQPDGTKVYRGNRESNGTLTNHGDGTYTYVFATDISSVTVDGNPVTYDRSALHRVAIMMGGHSGATADATYDFVPDGSTPVATRDIIDTSACKSCHGDSFHGHGGDRLQVSDCVTCHNASGFDAQSGNTIDMKVMIHKIHAGGDLPSVAGPDGDPWATADNGEYAIWGYQNNKMTWEKVGFPAEIENCTKCHTGSGANADNWELRPSRAACESCHDTLDLASPTTTHPAGQQLTDDNCAVCHKPNGLAPIDKAHDWTTKDPRNLAEYTLDVSMTPPANGQFYTGDEAPVISIVLDKNGTPIADHRILKGSAQGCTPSGNPLACPPDADGKFADTTLLVHGPRASNSPVLTTKARAQLASTAGSFTIGSASSLDFVVDQGVDLVLDDNWGTHVPGTFSVAVPAGSYTAAQLAALLDGNASFAPRAIADVEGGVLVVRSRNKGKIFSIQVGASAANTAVFGGDTSIHVPGGFTASVTLASSATSVGGIPAAADDPKVTLFTDHIEYQLDPVTDLQPGTYIVQLEISQEGRVSDTNYRTPAIAKVPFQVGTSTVEKKVAGNCNSCHESASGKGMVLDPARHHKVLDDTALDQCGGCHDYQPQDPDCPLGDPTCGVNTYSGWSGGRPISKRVHAIHNGANLLHPLSTVDYSNGDPVTGRNWDIEFPQDVRNCQTCHVDGATSGTWATNPNRLACSGCHDGDAALTHMTVMTFDPTPTMPWSGDEQESCQACH